MKEPKRKVSAPSVEDFNDDGSERYGLSLPPEHLKLVLEYVKDYNLSKAAIRCGMVEKKSGKISISAYTIYRSKLFREAIYLIEKDLDERYQSSKEKVMRELASIAFSNVKDIIMTDDEGGIQIKDLEDIPDHISKAIKKIKISNHFNAGIGMTQNVTAELYDKISAIDKLGKQMGMFIERREHTGAGGSDLIPKSPTRIVFDFGDDKLAPQADQG